MLETIPIITDDVCSRPCHDLLHPAVSLEENNACPPHLGNLNIEHLISQFLVAPRAPMILVMLLAGTRDSSH